MIPRGSEPRNGTPITLVAVHTAEGATTTASLAGYLDQPGVEASYHVLVDDNGAYRYLPDDVAAWAMLSGNHRSIQLCFTGFARWPRSEWLVHDNMLRAGAAVARTWCTTHNIPMVKLSPAQVGADQHGICGHWDWTLGKQDGTHTDPGAFFPWDVFINYVTSGHSPQPTPPLDGPSSIGFMNYGDTSAEISRLQEYLNRTFPSYSHINPVSGYYGDQTTAVVKEFQRRVGIVGADGRNVGELTRAKLWEHGFKG